MADTRWALNVSEADCETSARDTPGRCTWSVSAAAYERAGLLQMGKRVGGSDVNPGSSIAGPAHSRRYDLSEHATHYGREADCGVRDRSAMPAENLEVGEAQLDDEGNVDQQVAALRSIRDELTRTKATAELIDVRFGDRPYFR